MTDRKLTLFIARFCYSGNGGYASELPQIGDFVADTLHKCKADNRIEKVMRATFSDTPITMTRNIAIKTAQQHKADLLLMIDSDNAPDVEPDGKPFWDTSFNKIYDHYEQGPLVIFAPYCGPPPHENPYVFEWRNFESDNPNAHFKLEGMTREHAVKYSGFVDVGAGPTGLMLIDMRAINLLSPPYFRYEWTDVTESEKASTEDVYFTRNLSLAGQEKLNYNPLLCNFDSWAGHAKQKMVRKPVIMSAKHVHQTLREAVLTNHDSQQKTVIRGPHTDPPGQSP